ncbi:integrase core domain-containing protein [Emticicia sp. 17c]|uniref:integrase core domain-containing protein n=1 Tax=Emticicia sp. 17c TaxID=3127704 RepID=UPI003FA573EB
MVLTTKPTSGLDGKHRAIDNVFVERLWRTIKNEYIYLKSYQNSLYLKQSLKEFFGFYNQRKFHQSLNSQKPDKVYH